MGCGNVVFEMRAEDTVLCDLGLGFRAWGLGIT